MSCWIAGGWAIDLFLGRQTRMHRDLDIVIDRRDQLSWQKALPGWHLAVPDPPGKGELRPWREDEYLELPLHNVWAGRTRQEWTFELLLSEFEDDGWSFRRDLKIGGPVSEFGWMHEGGFRVIAPEVQLLYKSNRPRPKDEHDLQVCLPHMSPASRQRLRHFIERASGSQHQWIPLISESRE